MPEKVLYRNARDATLALPTSRKDIDEDAARAAVGVAEEERALVECEVFLAQRNHQCFRGCRGPQGHPSCGPK